MVDIFVNVQEDVALGLLGGRKAKTGDDDDEFVRISCCGVAMAAIDEEDMFLCGRQVTGPSSGCCGKCLGAFVRCLDRVPLPTVWFKFIACVILLALLLASGVAIVLLTDDETKTAVDAVYFVVISATTVGYGDRVIDGNAQRVVWSVWLMLVVVLLAKMFDEFTDARVHRHMKDLTAKLKKMELSKQAIREMDFDNDGRVSKVEFLRRKMDEAFDADVMSMFDQILVQFDKLDYCSDGFLDEHDLRTPARAAAAAAAAAGVAEAGAADAGAAEAAPVG